MQKRCVHKRFVLLAILMALALVALIGGSFVLSSAYAANHGSLQEAATQKTVQNRPGVARKSLGARETQVHLTRSLVLTLAILLPWKVVSRASVGPPSSCNPKISCPQSI